MKRYYELEKKRFIQRKDICVFSGIIMAVGILFIGQGVHGDTRWDVYQPSNNINIKMNSFNIKDHVDYAEQAVQTVMSSVVAETKQAITQPVLPKPAIRTTKRNEKKTINRLSFYNPWDPAQTDDSPGICAWGLKYKKGDHIIAISRDLEKYIPNGSKVRIYGLPSNLPTVYTVADRMNERYRNSIDVAIPMELAPTLYSQRNLADKYGVLEGVRIEKI